MTVPSLLIDPTLLQSVTPAVGAVLAAAIVAIAGLLGYGRQKKLDRESDLVGLKQEEYKKYLLAFQQASRFKGEAAAAEKHAEQAGRFKGEAAEKQHAEAEAAYHEAQKKHAEAEAAYHEGQNFMLLHSSREVIKAAYAANKYYVETEPVDWRTYKKLYATMIEAMRRDGFSQTEGISVEELADNIPWTIGTELEDRKALGESQGSKS